MGRLDSLSETIRDKFDRRTNIDGQYIPVVVFLNEKCTAKRGLAIYRYKQSMTATHKDLRVETMYFPPGLSTRDTSDSI